jgi:hypothetical protein
MLRFYTDLCIFFKNAKTDSLGNFIFERIIGETSTHGHGTLDKPLPTSHS